MSIPEVLHFYWHEPHVPEPFAGWEARWRTLHQDWRVECWHPGRMPALRHSHLLSLCDNPAEVSDVLRILLLADHGGVWTDRDTWPVAPIDALTVGSDAFLVCLRRRWAETWVESCLLGAAPGQPFWDFAAERLRQNMEDPGADWRTLGPFSRTLYKTGPRFLDRCLRQWAEGPENHHGAPDLVPAAPRWRASLAADAPSRSSQGLPERAAAPGAVRLYGVPLVSWRHRDRWLAGDTQVPDGALVMHLFAGEWCPEADRWKFEGPDDGPHQQAHHA